VGGALDLVLNAFSGGQRRTLSWNGIALSADAGSAAAATYLTDATGNPITLGNPLPTSAAGGGVSQPNNADSVAPTGTGNVDAFAYFFDGTNWQRARTATGAVAGRGLSASIQDALTTQLATVAQQHLGDNQVQPATGGAMLTSGPSQVTNLETNASRLRETGADQQPSLGIQAGVTSLVQRYPNTSTTTITAGAATAALTFGAAIAATKPAPARFVGTQITLEAGTANEEYAYVTAATTTTVTIAFGAAGAKFTHTQPYAISLPLFNMESDFAGEGSTGSGTGAALASDFDTSMGGPPLAGGLASGFTLDADRNLQGKNTQQKAITAVGGGALAAAATALQITAGAPELQPRTKLILSNTAAGAAVEEVIVSQAFIPSTVAPLVVALEPGVPVVTGGETFATYDSFGMGVPASATTHGVEEVALLLYDPAAPDPKRPLYLWQGSAGIPKVAAILDGNIGRLLGSALNADAQSGGAQLGVHPYAYRGDTTFDRTRTPVVFKTAAVTAAGSTALWTPAAGKKFRAMRYMLIVTDQATLAAGATLTIDLLDAAGNLAQTHSVFVPSVGLTGGVPLYVSPWIDLGNGILSSAANNVLNVNLSAALTAGVCRVLVCGTEE
jgi:hypothetical protein